MFFDCKHLQLQLLDVLQFNDTNLNSRVPARSFCALSLRLEADTEIILKNKTTSLASHDLAFFPANIPYVRRTKHDHMIVFHFFAQNYIGNELEVLHDFSYKTVYPLYEEALHEWTAKSPGYYYRVNSIFYQILADIQKNIAHDISYSPLITAAINEIKDHSTDSAFNIAKLSSQLHFSDTYIRRLFKQEFGVSPKQYLTNYRMVHAQSLLNAGYDSVEIIAEKVGFRDSKNFATAFKKHFGYPPSKQSYTI